MRTSLLMQLKKINTALPGLLFGMILFGIICQAAGFFLVEDKADYSKGLWIGVLTGIFMAFHMAISINSAVERDVKGGAGGSDKTEYYPLSCSSHYFGNTNDYTSRKSACGVCGNYGFKNFRIFTTAASETVTSKRKKQDGVCKN